jgi:hypothetical protein
MNRINKPLDFSGFEKIRMDKDGGGASKSLKDFVATFDEVRHDLRIAYAKTDINEFHFMVHKFYGGLLSYEPTCPTAGRQ